MNEIKFPISKPVDSESIYKKHKVYRVFLGVGKPLEFTNKQEAGNYTAMLSVEINKFIRISNSVYSDVFQLYRNVWPGMEPIVNKKLVEFCEKLNHSFNLIYERDYSTTFNTCLTIYQTLLEMIKYLETYLKRRKIYLQLYKLNAIEAILNSDIMAIHIIRSRMKFVS